MKTPLAPDRILRRDGTVVPYDRRRIEQAVCKAAAASATPDHALAGRVTDRVEAALAATYRPGVLPSVEDVQDLVENVLMESGQTRLARHYIIYRHQRAQLRAARSAPFEMSDIIPYRKIYEVLLWNLHHRCDSIPAMNEWIASGRFPALVRACEARYREEIERAADGLMERADRTRLVIVAGPSSSGKTTTTRRLGDRLRRRGLRLRAINVDHYFRDLEYHPRDEFGDYDYETPQALDLGLINEHLEQLLDGRTVRTPHYDFPSGKQTRNVHPLRLEKGEILLIDSLHGLYKEMTRRVADSCKFRIYIETLGQFRSEKGHFMRWADHRLLRRMIRDQRHRNSQPLQTIMHWHYVRTSELTYIIPFLNTADCVVNTAMPYEIPVLKGMGYEQFPKAMRAFRRDPRRRDAYVRARRVYEFLRPLQSVTDTDAIPRVSVLREFIGGGRYRLH